MIVSEMLPELLFSVGGSMQDFTKEEFGLLGGSVVSSDKDLGSQNQHFNASIIHTSHHHPALHHHHHHGIIEGNVPESTVTADDIKLSQTSDLIDANEGAKLEEADRDLYPWSTNHIGSQFLRSSDDPLISGGTNDNHNDNELSVAAGSQSMCSSPTPPPTQKHRNSIVVPTSILSPELPDTPISLLPTPVKSYGGNSGRRGAGTTGSGRQRRKGPIKLRFHHQALPPEYLDHYEASQNIAAKREQQQQQQQQNYCGTRSSRMEKHADQAREDRTNESVRNWLQKILELQKEGVSLAPIKDKTESNEESCQRGTSEIQKNRIISYSDLPYMGEMTLDNSKPRRGRKPKKADICHLIYKNYGTILPGTPKPESLLEKPPNGQRAQTRSTSLLERRLMSNEKVLEKSSGKREEPLNLCVRDAGGDSLALSSSDDESDGVYDSSCPTPIITPTDINTDQALAANMKMSLPNLHSSGVGTPSSGETPTSVDNPPGYMYWPNMGGFIHPMALYYQKLVDSNNTVTPGQSSSSTSNSVPSTPTEILNTKPSISSTHSTPSPSSSVAPTREPQQTLVPKPISQLIKPEKISKPQSPTTKRSPPTQKRKRSAIFIPPVPAENSTNPATEVSICKFKFTGGAKPCLQEKKMLSVDSGGNFRYYSGTGDKSMRGYEFFPRESLQQSSLHATTTTGAFLNTPPVEKIACDLPPPSLGLSNDILQIPDFAGTAGLTGLASPSIGSNQGRRNASSDSTEARRTRRRSRRTSQRESLEKTFKEKGFLIQTQQLQSAEGATYCKFRQLRKFTRYLFRSWKDYLPGEMQQQRTTSGEHPHDGLPMSAPVDLFLDEDSPLLGCPRSRLINGNYERSTSSPSSISSPPSEVIQSRSQKRPSNPPTPSLPSSQASTQLPVRFSGEMAERLS